MPRTKKEVKSGVQMGKGREMVLTTAWIDTEDRGHPEVRGAGVKEDPELLREIGRAHV